MTGKNEFDALAKEYDQLLKNDLGALGGDLSVFAEYKVKLAQKLLSPAPKSILEFGCGIGRNFPYFSYYFPDATISGCDSSEKSIAAAQSKFTNRRFFLSSTIHEFLRNAEEYDAVFIACVLHHIPQQEWHQWLDAIKQKTQRDGKIIVFEHNLHNPVVKRIVSKSPIDASANFLDRKACCTLFQKAGYIIAASGYTMFFPKRTSLLEKLEWRLRKIPLGGQYYVVARKET